LTSGEYRASYSRAQEEGAEGTFGLTLTLFDGDLYGPYRNPDVDCSRYAAESAGTGEYDYYNYGGYWALPATPTQADYADKSDSWRLDRGRVDLEVDGDTARLTTSDIQLEDMGGRLDGEFDLNGRFSRCTVELEPGAYFGAPGLVPPYIYGYYGYYGYGSVGRR